MAAVTPALGAIGTIASVGGTVLQSQQAAKAQRQSRRAEEERIKQQQVVDTADRQDRLRRAVAAQRARFSAGGVSTSGSGANVLAALEKETNDDINQSNALSRLRLSSLNSGNGSSTSRSLIDFGKVLTSTRI